MTKKEQTQILEKAIQTYGVDKQLDMLVEECAELISAVIHYKRGRVKALTDLLSELADVEIMLKQMKMIFNNWTLEELVVFKLYRLKKRLDSGE